MNVTDGPALHARFLRGLALSPDRLAVRLGADSLTYTEVHRRALSWAGALLAGPGEPPEVIGVLAGKGVEAYVAILAGLYTGRTVVPLRSDFPVARTRRMLEVAGVQAVVADRFGLANLVELAAEGLDLPVLAPGHGLDEEGKLRGLPLRGIALDEKDALTEPRPVSATDRAYVLFTSGSTGTPKGVPISHGSTHHYFELLDQRYDFNADDIFSQTFDVNFDCAVFDMFCAWGAGATLLALPNEAYHDLPGYLTQQGVTVWFSTPSAISLVRRTRGLKPDSMPGLRWSLFAGEALRAADATDWQDAAPNSTLENIYGPTELTVTVTGYRWDRDTSPVLCVNGLTPIGTVHEGHDFVLLAPNGVPSLTEGELCITGPQMTTGYLDPTDDQGRFLEHEGRRWYRTGDRVRQHGNGVLVYLGRLDAQVQVQGWRVELAEIDHALRVCVGVQDAVAVAREGANGTELVVFYVGEKSPPAELARQLREVLPHSMVPRHYRHVEDFPLNANRKVDRGLLARQAAAELEAVPA
ncbi:MULTISPECIES: AMP-binding protein [unclassified Kitasatospora]|uniref:AMP-binding protein n=1 Tax=unclassified Kitasatospora TaxID=2633591 RepID=UPI00070C0485|nr:MULTISPECIES: AMP-binding protein [unclassified Kitasatospora]KQV20056.1 D-alanine--poly(phosphoribitol) ligase [Kitasatospora sp. Root107]KRB71214.1 D-alanine--poly(phosphoribitol) ligase [Kitasatospora sp. Root187]